MQTALRSLVVCSLLILASCQPAPEEPEIAWSALTKEQQRQPAYAHAGLSVADGYTLTQFASEPMLINPSNMDIDPKGRVWVCEALNYRNKWNPKNPYREGGDRILILEDLDHDGKADTSKVFYQGTDINGALGIAVIGDKVIVSASPNVWVFTDADGDDIPEKKEALFAGMGGVDDDHGHHAFVFGPDGRYYFNFGNAGGRLADAEGELIKDDRGRLITNAGAPFRDGMALRYDPESGETSVLGHNFRNNFELSVDSYGTVWQSDNDDDGNFAVRINYVMEGGQFGYKDEFTGAGWRAARVNSHPEVPMRHWHQNDPGVVPNLLMTGAGSPTGILAYEGSLFPSSAQYLIHADAGPAVVRAYSIQDDGAGYQADIIPLVEKAGDDWFRPSDVCVAPDGSLFISDWYDPVVGGNAMGDTARGRIYRLSSKDQTTYQVEQPDLSTADGALAALQNPNIATRAAAWLALREMGTAAESALQSLWQNGSPPHQARALWLLAHLPQGSSYLEEALQGNTPLLQLTAIRAAQQLIAAPLVLFNKIAADSSPAVRREVALALRYHEGPAADALWAELASQYKKGDRWYLEALGIGGDVAPAARFAAWQRDFPDAAETPAGRDIIWRMRAPAALAMLETRIMEAPSANAAKRYIRALDFHAPEPVQSSLVRMLKSLDDDQDELAYLLLMQVDGKKAMRNLAVRKRLLRTLEQTAQAGPFLDLVERTQTPKATRRLHEIAISSSNLREIERAVQILQGMGKLDVFKKDLKTGGEQGRKGLIALRFADNASSIQMLEAYALDSAHPLPLRKVAAESLANGWNSETRLVELLQEGALPEPVKIAGATKLLGVWRVAYRNIAADILQVQQQDDFTPIAELLAREGDPDLGPAIYQQHCMSCHQIAGEGTNFGPALTEIGSKLSTEALLAAIMQPGAGISYGYEGYFIETADGQKLTGYIASETASSITLSMQGGATKSIPQTEIVRQEALEASLMTTGLHQAMGEEALVNLVAYLKTLKRTAPPIARR